MSTVLDVAAILMTGTLIGAIAILIIESIDILWRFFLSLSIVCVFLWAIDRVFLMLGGIKP